MRRIRQSQYCAGQDVFGEGSSAYRAEAREALLFSRLPGLTRASSHPGPSTRSPHEIGRTNRNAKLEAEVTWAESRQ